MRRQARPQAEVRRSELVTVLIGGVALGIGSMAVVGFVIAVLG